MKIQTLGDVLDLTRLMHQRLSECLAQNARHAEPSSEKWLLVYLSDHEKALADMVSAFEASADKKAIDTWVVDYLSRRPIDPEPVCEASLASMDCEEIGRLVLDLHNQVMDLYGGLLGRAEIPETRELLQAVLEMEQHETLRLAHQMNAGRDL